MELSTCELVVTSHESRFVIVKYFKLDARKLEKERIEDFSPNSLFEIQLFCGISLILNFFLKGKSNSCNNPTLNDPSCPPATNPTE